MSHTRENTFAHPIFLFNRTWRVQSPAVMYMFATIVVLVAIGSVDCLNIGKQAPKFSAEEKVTICKRFLLL